MERQEQKKQQEQKKMSPERIAYLLSGKGDQKAIEFYRSEGMTDEQIAEMAELYW